MNASTAPTGPQEDIGAFYPLATPGMSIFIPHGYVYAPAMGDVPAQIFVGEWSCNSKGTDLAVWDIARECWQVVGIEGTSITSYLYVDPFRPVVFMMADARLLEIDRRTLQVREVAKAPSKLYGGDFAPDGSLWLSLGRSLFHYAPATGAFRAIPDITPDGYTFVSNHMLPSVGPDGRIWFVNTPVFCLCVYDPQTGAVEVIWDEARERAAGGTEIPGAMQNYPVVTDDTVWAGPRFFDVRTGALKTMPAAITVGGYLPLRRQQWYRTPNQHCARGNTVMVRQENSVGRLNLDNGEFQLLGTVAGAAARLDAGFCGMDEDRFFYTLRRTAPRPPLIRYDMVTGVTREIELDFQKHFSQSVWAWTIGGSGSIYGNCCDHTLWEVTAAGEVRNHGDMVPEQGGENFFYAWWQEQLYIASYTHSIMTRVDTSRPLGAISLAPAANPRRIANLWEMGNGQHRPSAMKVSAWGTVYMISRSDYCQRNDGAIIAVDAASGEILQHADPLLEGDPLWSLAISPTRREVYVGTDFSRFLVLDADTLAVKESYQLPARPNDGTPTTAMIRIGGVRFLGATGDLVVGNKWGTMEYFVYNARTRTLSDLITSPYGRVCGVFDWQARGSLLLYVSEGLYEMTADGVIALRYPAPLPGYNFNTGPDGRIYISDGHCIFAETHPVHGR